MVGSDVAEEAHRELREINRGRRGSAASAALRKESSSRGTLVPDSLVARNLAKFLPFSRLPLRFHALVVVGPRAAARACAGMSLAVSIVAGRLALRGKGISCAQSALQPCLRACSPAGGPRGPRAPHGEHRLRRSDRPELRHLPGLDLHARVRPDPDRDDRDHGDLPHHLHDRHLGLRRRGRRDRHRRGEGELPSRSPARCSRRRLGLGLDQLLEPGPERGGCSNGGSGFDCARVDRRGRRRRHAGLGVGSRGQRRDPHR